MLIVSYSLHPEEQSFCSKCGDSAHVKVSAVDGKITDWLCSHCAAHHMRGNAEAIDDREPEECECPADRWVA